MKSPQTTKAPQVPPLERCFAFHREVEGVEEEGISGPVLVQTLLVSCVLMLHSSLAHREHFLHYRSQPMTIISADGRKEELPREHFLNCNSLQLVQMHGMLWRHRTPAARAQGPGKHCAIEAGSPFSCLLFSKDGNIFGISAPVQFKEGCTSKCSQQWHDLWGHPANRQVRNYSKK